MRSSQTEAVFSRTLPKRGLEIIKTYRLAKVPAADQNSATYGAYHLEFDVAIRNIGDQERQVAYQLDGPTGLPIEGYWYANKVSRSWSASGLRDVVVSLEGNAPKVISAPKSPMTILARSGKILRSPTWGLMPSISRRS